MTGSLDRAWRAHTGCCPLSSSTCWGRRGFVWSAGKSWGGRELGAAQVKTTAWASPASAPERKRPPRHQVKTSLSLPSLERMQLPLKRQPLKKTIDASIRGHVWPSLLPFHLLNKNKYHYLFHQGAVWFVIRACEQSGSIGVGISLRAIWKMSSCAFREVLEPCTVRKAWANTMNDENQMLNIFFLFG